MVLLCLLCYQAACLKFNLPPITASPWIFCLCVYLREFPDFRQNLSSGEGKAALLKCPMDMMKYTYRFIQQIEFLRQTQPLSLLPRGRLMAELMGPWPCSPKHYGTLASPVITETSVVAGSQRLTLKMHCWGRAQGVPCES